MTQYIIRRLLQSFLVILGVVTAVFIITNMTGDPVALMLGEASSAEDIERLREQLGLNEPLYTQFFTWIGKLLQGDLGQSLISNKPVFELIASRVEPSISIALSTIILAILVAVPLGVIAAWKHGTPIDRFVMGLSVVGFSVVCCGSSPTSRRRRCATTTRSGSPAKAAGATRASTRTAANN